MCILQTEFSFGEFCEEEKAMATVVRFVSNPFSVR
jgi:hypothetical protein